MYIGTYQAAAVAAISGNPQMRLNAKDLRGTRLENKKYNPTIANGKTMPIRPFASNARPEKK